MMTWNTPTCTIFQMTIKLKKQRKKVTFISVHLCVRLMSVIVVNVLVVVLLHSSMETTPSTKEIEITIE